jgi:4-aminobutyrate aminotransferase-like enzyme
VTSPCRYATCSGSESNDLALRVARTNCSCGAPRQGPKLMHPSCPSVLCFCSHRSKVQMSGQSVAGAQHVVVMDGAYHGHTTATIDLSPYKFNGAGGSGR